MKSKSSGKLTRTQWIIIVATTLILGAILLIIGYDNLRQNSGTLPASPSEVVIVPFSRLEPTFTEQLYSGTVTLVISGSGQAGGSDYSDAFYLYQRGDGTSYDPPLLEQFDLELDGQRAIYTLNRLDNPPPYSTDHTYEVTYDLGSQPRQIALRISDSNVDDNSGEFRVEIIPQG